jgi:hypothetical protein
MANKPTNCIYCGQEVHLIYEHGRPKTLQNGRPHQCSFSKLGLANVNSEVSRNQGDSSRSGRKSGKPGKAGRWAIWGGLFG